MTRLVAGLRGQPGSRVTRDDFGVVARWLSNWLRRRYSLSPADAEEIAVATIEAVFEASADPSKTEPDIRRPVAYLVWTAGNRAVDRLRRETVGEAAELKAAGRRATTDDEVVALFDREASQADVRDAMAAAAAAGEHLVVRLVGVWLNLAEERGERPRSRDVAKRAGVSHTSVNQALRRFRVYFPDDAARSS